MLAPPNQRGSSTLEVSPIALLYYLSYQYP
ncbi:hypothetical protein BRC2024_QFGIOCBO_CDS_0241 [Acinetobacter phage vB_AbaM_PhT2-v2]